MVILLSVGTTYTDDLTPPVEVKAYARVFSLTHGTTARPSASKGRTGHTVENLAAPFTPNPVRTRPQLRSTCLLEVRVADSAMTRMTSDSPTRGVEGPYPSPFTALTMRCAFGNAAYSRCGANGIVPSTVTRAYFALLPDSNSRAATSPLNPARL